MKINERAAGVELSGHGGGPLLSLPCRLLSWLIRDRRTDSSLLLVSTGVSVLSSIQRGENKQFPCRLHSLNLHPFCSKRKRKKKGRRRKQASHFLWHLKLGERLR